MKCRDPILCYDDGVTKKFRHFSLSSPIFKLQHNIVFDCRKCTFCRKKQSLELAMRCVLHASLYKENCFLTLTYDEKKPEYHNVLQYSDIQKFKKSLRRHCDYHLDRKIQIFNVHEYGKMGKKHWHLVILNFMPSERRLHTTSSGHPLYTSEIFHKLWPHGFHTIGDVSEASAMYQTQYMQKDLKNNNMTNGKKAHSKHSGLGRDYFLKHFEQILSLGYIPFGGKKVPLPRYFEKLAHKHWSHFYQTENFFDTKQRKRLYNPFKQNQANKRLADLYQQYDEQKKIKIEQLSQEWELEIENYIYNSEKPDFMKAAENYDYDQKLKTNKLGF